jgi:hypothetical protein
MLMSKINFKQWKKLYYFYVFPNEKNFKKQPLLQYQKNSKGYSNYFFEKKNIKGGVYSPFLE